MDAPPQLIDQFEILWRDRIALQVSGDGSIEAELDQLRSAMRLPLPIDYVRVLRLIGSRSKHVFPQLSCSIADAIRLTAELPDLLAQKGFGTSFLQDRGLAFAETGNEVYFVDLASGMDDPMSYAVCRLRDEHGYDSRGSMMQVFLEFAMRRWC